MMKLSTMHTVVATVNDRWESSLAEALLMRWEHDPVPATFWRASANFIFFFKCAGQDCVLRFNHESERTAHAIQAELNYVNHLAVHGIRVAKPIRSLAGNTVESLATEQGVFHAVAFAALPGKHIDLEDLTLAQYGQWGQALGDLHRAAAHYPPLGRPTWEEQLTFVATTLPAEEQAARQTLDRLTMQLRQLPTDAAHVGMIHFDFELDNLLWHGDQIGVIDLDNSAWYWFVADLAFALRDLFADRVANVDLQHESLRHFVAGYRQSRAISDAELTLIPLFLQLHQLISFAKLYRTMTPINPAGELPWMDDLRDKLATKMQFYREQFAV